MVKAICLCLGAAVLAFAASVFWTWLFSIINRKDFKLFTIPVYAVCLFLVPVVLVLIGEPHWTDTLTAIVFGSAAVGMIAGELYAMLRFKDDIAE